MPGTIRDLLGGLAALVVAAGTAAADGPFPRHDQLPLAVSQDLAPLARLLAASQARPVRLLLLGDSQETCPGGWGAAYGPALNERLYERFGPVGITPLMTNLSCGGGNPPAQWLMSGGFGGSPVPALAGGAAQLLPSTLARAFHGAATPFSGAGWLTTLRGNGSATADTFLSEQPYFQGAGEIGAEILVLSTTGGGGLRWQARPAAAAGAGYTAAATNSGAVPASAIQGAPGEVALLATGPLDSAGLPFMQLEVEGDSAVAETVVLGVRFLDLGSPVQSPRGLLVESFSEGGYTVQSHLNTHSEAGPMLRAIDPDAIMIQLGANDFASAGATPDSFHAGLQQLIARVRLWMDDPCLPIILVGEASVPSLFFHDGFSRSAGVAADLALSEPNVHFINLRRAMELWHGCFDGEWCAHYDMAHFTPWGQRRLARALGQLLVDVEMTGQSCPGDFDGDAAVGSADLAVLLAQFGVAGSCALADMDGDARVDASDLAQLLAAWGPCPN